MSESDTVLLQKTVAGDREAFGALVESYQSTVFRYARTLCSSDQMAEDVLQETFLAAFASAESFRGQGSAKAWLLTIARNKAFRLGRPRAGQPDRLESLDELGQAAGWGAEPGPEHLAMRSEQREVLNRALNKLSDGDRELLILRDLEGLSGDEVAQLLSLGRAAMKSRLHRARLRFAARLREEVQDGA